MMGARRAMAVVVLFSTACDGGADDPAIDAPDPTEDAGPSIDAPPALVRVTADSPGCVTEFNRAVVNRADGSAVPGFTGVGPVVAAIEIQPGDSITSSANDHEVQSVLGVQDGDLLTFGRYCGRNNLVRRLVATWTAFPGATSYIPSTNCDGAPTMALRYTLSSCTDRDPDKDDLLIMARDAAGPIAYSWSPGISVAAQDATAVAGAWQPATELTVRIDALPGAGQRTIRWDVRNRSFGVYGRDEVIDALPATLRVAAPAAGPPVRILTTIDGELISTTAAPGTTSSTLSVPEHLSPVGDVSYNLATHRVSFRVLGEVPYDVAVVHLRWLVPDARQRTWDILVPAGVTSFTLPRHATLPASFHDDGMPRDIRIDLVSRADVTSYDEALAVPLWAMFDRNAAQVSDATGLMQWASYLFPQK